jgi:hypothetical protein
VTNAGVDLTLSNSKIYMANGPHCADAVEEYLRQAAVFSGDEELFEETDKGSVHEGELEVSLGDHFHESGELIQEGEEEVFELPEVAENSFQALDEIYDALKTHRGNNRLENFRYGYAFSMNHRKGPAGGTWEKEYLEAGLIDEEGEVTDEGEVFLDLDPRGNDYRFDSVSVAPEEDEVGIGEIYNNLRTTSNSSSGENNGGKIHAFLLYAAGFEDREVAEAVDLEKSHLRQTKKDMKKMKLFDRDYSLTQDGRAMVHLMKDQIRSLEEVKREKIEARIEPANGYMEDAVLYGE